MRTRRRRKLEERIFKVLMRPRPLVVLGSLLAHPRDGRRQEPAGPAPVHAHPDAEGRLLPGQGRRHPQRHPRLALPRRRGDAPRRHVRACPIVLYLNLYARKTSAFATFTRFSLDVLWGIPSIVYGAFGFIVMMSLGLRASLLAGHHHGRAPRAPDHGPGHGRGRPARPAARCLDASDSLGATRLETALKVVVRQALPGIMTAVLIAFGRGIGDAASVLFTAGFTDSVPTSLLRPAATLPLAIFFQLGTPIPRSSSGPTLRPRS